MMKKVYIFLFLLFFMIRGAIMPSALRIKVGNSEPNPLKKRHLTALCDGAICDIRPENYFNGKLTLKHYAILIVNDNLDPINDFNIKKLLYGVDKNGKRPWDMFYDLQDGPVRKRDYFVDLTLLMQEGRISASKLSDIYDKNCSVTPIILNCSLVDILKHEDQDTRVNPLKMLSPGSTSEGDKYIGSGKDFEDITAFADDLITLTDDCNGFHENEETDCTSPCNLDIDTNGYKLTLTAKPGSAWDGKNYDACTGARVNYANYDNVKFTGDIKNVELSQIAFDCRGASNYNIGLYVTGLNNQATLLCNRCLFEGDAVSTCGVTTYQNLANSTFNLRNTVINGFSKDHTTWQNGCAIATHGGFASHAVTMKTQNVTIIKSTIGFHRESTSHGTHTLKNILAQDNGTDFNVLGGGETTAQCISEDNTSPTVAKRNLDKHDKVENWTNGDMRLKENDDDINDGVDLNAEFTDDMNHNSGRRPVGGIWDIGASQFQRAVAAGRGYKHWEY
jgi:hypothetical protein